MFWEKKVLSNFEFFLNVSSGGSLDTVGRAFHRREAAELKARSATRKSSTRYKQFRICRRAQISLTWKCGDWLQLVGIVRWCSTVQ